MKQFKGMFVANLKEFVRDKSALFWMLAFPLVFIFLFGVIFSGIEFAFILPGILAMALMQLGLFGSLQFVILREKKIIRGLSVTPLSISSLLSSEIVVRLLAGIAQATIILLVGKFIFDVTLVGSLLHVFLLVLLGAVTFISFGYMLTCFVKTSEAATGLMQVVQMPMMFLAGIFFPLEMMPEFLEPVTRIIPLTYLVDALRQVMIGNYSEFSMVMNLSVLGIWLVASGLVAVKFWKWE